MRAILAFFPNFPLIFVQNLGNDPQLPGHFIFRHDPPKVQLWTSGLGTYFHKKYQVITMFMTTLSEPKMNDLMLFICIIPANYRFRIKTNAKKNGK
jgi:hypothetical protein